ncbi:MAG: glycosyltransferase family 4 protein [Pirellula sp.]
MTSLANPSFAYADTGLPTLLMEPAQSKSTGSGSPTLDIQSLHLINGEHFSGAERVQQLLGKCLPRFGIGAHFVCLKTGKFPQLCGLPSDQVCTIEMSSRFDFGIAKRIADHANRIGAHVLHAHTPRTAMIASFVARRCKLPWVYHVHSPTARDSTRSMINRINDWVEAYSLRNAKHIITVSKSLRREMLSFGHARHKVTAIANGVAEQIPIDPNQRIDVKHWRLGMVALVRPRKGIEVLLDALSLLGNDRHRVTLDVIGSFETSEYEKRVRQRVQRLGIESTVNFQGFCNDIPTAMRSLDGMILPSLFGEGMPMVVLEALACGVPVIATKVEGTPEIVRNGHEGLLADPQDAISLAGAIQKFIGSRHDWCRMSREAVQRHRSGFSDVNMARKTAKVYRKLTIAKRVEG